MTAQRRLWIFLMSLIVVLPQLSITSADEISSGRARANDGERPEEDSGKDFMRDDELLLFMSTATPSNSSDRLPDREEEDAVEGSGEPLIFASRRTQVTLQRSQVPKQSHAEIFLQKQKEPARHTTPPTVQSSSQNSSVLVASERDRKEQTLAQVGQPKISAETNAKLPEIQSILLSKPKEPEVREKPQKPLDIPPLKLTKLTQTPPSSTCSAFASNSKILLYMVCDGENGALTHKNETSNGFTVYETLLEFSSARSKRDTTQNIPPGGKIGNKILRVETKVPVKLLKTFIAGNRLFVIAIMKSSYSLVYELRIDKDQTAGKSRIIQQIPHNFLTDVSVIYVGHGRNAKVYLAFSAYAVNCNPNQKHCHGGSPVYRFIKGALSLCDYVGAQHAVSVRGWEDSGTVVLTYVSYANEQSKESFLSFFEVNDSVDCHVTPSKTQPHIDQINGKTFCGIRAVEPFWRSRKTYLAVGLSSADSPNSCPPNSIEKSFILSSNHQTERIAFSTDKVTYFPGSAKVSGFNLLDTSCTSLIQTFGSLSTTDFHKVEVRDGQLVITTVPDLHDAPDNILESAVAFQEDRAYVSFSRPDSHDLPVLELSCPDDDKQKKGVSDQRKGRPHNGGSRGRNHTGFNSRHVFKPSRDGKRKDALRQTHKVANDDHQYPPLDIYRLRKNKYNASLADSTKKSQGASRTVPKPSRQKARTKEFISPPPPVLVSEENDRRTVPRLPLAPSSAPFQNFSIDQRHLPPPNGAPFMNQTFTQRQGPLPIQQLQPIRDVPPPPVKDFSPPVQDLPSLNKIHFFNHTSPQLRPSHKIRFPNQTFSQLPSMKKVRCSNQTFNQPLTAQHLSVPVILHHNPPPRRIQDRPSQHAWQQQMFGQDANFFLPIHPSVPSLNGHPGRNQYENGKAEGENKRRLKVDQH